MASSSSKSASNQHIRSISLPSRSHPSTLGIEEELNSLNINDHKSTTLNSLSELNELYKRMSELLNLSSTQQVLSQHKNEKSVSELLDGSVKILDICGNMIDLVSQTKENLGEVQSSIRRRKGDSVIKTSVAKFFSCRKKMKKDSKKLTIALKQMDSEVLSSESLNNPDDHHFQSIIRLLREVRTTSICIFQSVLMFLSSPSSNKTKWSLVSSLMRKERVACETQIDDINELGREDIILSNLFKYGASKLENVEIAQSRLDALRSRTEETEIQLQCIFRQLVKSRASLLNIFSY